MRHRTRRRKYLCAACAKADDMTSTHADIAPCGTCQEFRVGCCRVCLVPQPKRGQR